jgi:hypothetical protein
VATLIACANGNLTTAATWELVDATSFNNSEAANTALTTALVASSTFTPGAITIDGIAVKLASRAASPSGTMDVELATGGVQVAGTGVTINVADLPLCTTGDLAGGWQFFKFAAPVLLLAATAYTVRAKTSVASQVNLYSLATTNWSRLLRTTTTQAPAAGDNMVICGEKTAAGAQTARAVTMDSTANTNYGSNVTGSSGLITPAMAICQGGTLAFGTAGSTNYILQLAGNLIVYAGGTLSIGTIGTEIPRGSTAWLQFNCAADLDFGLTVRNLGAYNHHGLSRTSGKDIWTCKLNANAAANATTLNVDTDTGWLSGDVIVVASTTRTAGECEKGTLNGAAGASSLTVNGFAGTGGGVQFAHAGTGTGVPVAEIILLTRNTGVRAVTSALCSFLVCRATSAVSITWAEFFYMGSSSGIASAAVSLEMVASPGSFLFQYCSIHDGDGAAFMAGSSPAAYNFTFQYVGIWNTPAATTGANVSAFLGPVNNTGTAYVISGVILMRGSPSTTSVTFSDCQGTVEDFTCIGGFTGISFANQTLALVYGSFRRITARACSQLGMQMSGATGTFDQVTFSDFNVIRNGTTGFSWGGIIATITNLTITGNSTNLSALGGGCLRINNLVTNSDPTFTSGVGILNGSNTSLIINGGSSGVTTAHTSGCFNHSGGGPRCVWNAPTIGDSVIAISQTAWAHPDAFFSITNKAGVALANTTYTTFGTITADTATFRTASPSQRLTPLIAAEKLVSAPVLVACNSGVAKTIGVYVQESAAYNGRAPRLMLRANAAIGVSADTVLATFAGGTGAWVLVSGPTPTPTADGAFEVYVDCDGTVGFVNLDDWAAT